jgi:cobalt-zinc-cadmium efflux system membrane fusion protein
LQRAHKEDILNDHEQHASSELEEVHPPSERSGVARLMRRVVIAVLLTVVVVPPAAGFYSLISGVPLHLLTGHKNSDAEGTAARSAADRIALVPDSPHTIHVSDTVAKELGIRNDGEFSIAVAELPKSMRPLVLPGSLALNPIRLARIKARFAPARVVEIAKIRDFDQNLGQTEFRELRPGDIVAKGDLLGVFYSVDVGSKKNDLLDGLVQLELDQRILDRVEKNRNAVPEVFYLTQLRAVQGDRNAIMKALNNLRLWDIPRDEIDALHAEAAKISTDKDAWYKTAEGRWVKGEQHSANEDSDFDNAGATHENPWGKVTLRAPFDGVIVEQNVHTDEMVVDNSVNLFQIADVSRMLVIASCPEDQLPMLESLADSDRRWTVRTVGAAAEGLTGTIDEIGYIIDPNQHTAIIKGYVENPGRRLRAGQFISATVRIPPPDEVVEIPNDALVDDGRQAIVFVQPDADKAVFVMRRVDVTHRFERSVFVRGTPLKESERLARHDAEQHLLPSEPLQPGERILLSGVLELKAALMDLEEEQTAKHGQ